MDKNIARMITFLARKSQSYIGSALSKYNLSVAEQPFFMALQRYEGITQEELTALVGVDKAVTTRAVRLLEGKGYLIRVQDEKDRRQNRVYPTDTAKQMADPVRKELLYFNDLLTRGISPEHLKIIHDGLLKMEENFSSISFERCLAAEQGGPEDESR